MATITPAIDRTIAKIPRVIWETITSADTPDALPISEQWGLAASVQIVGTFGGATVTMEHSNDGTNWVTAKDLQGTNISLNATGMAEFSLSSAYIRPLVSGGAAYDIDVIVVFRGLY